MQLFYIVLNKQEIHGPFNYEEAKEQYLSLKQKWNKVKLLSVCASEVFGETDCDE